MASRTPAQSRRAAKSTTPRPRPWTRADLARLPDDGNRYDVQVIPGPRQPANWDDAPAPILVVEVLSTSTRHRDFGVKLDAYLGRGGVPTVWIVGHRKREVHVVDRGATSRIERRTLEWLAPGAPVPPVPLVIDLPTLFTAALSA